MRNRGYPVGQIVRVIGMIGVVGFGTRAIFTGDVHTVFVMVIAGLILAASFAASMHVHNHGDVGGCSCDKKNADFL